MGQILLYYKYVTIADTAAILDWQKQLCARLGLHGRIILAGEGINGTVGGTDEATQSYITAMNEHELFGDIDFKKAPGDETYFPKMRVVVKEEIVRMGVSPEELTIKDGGTHLAPAAVHELLENKPDDLVVLDTRNDYESRIGQFVDAVIPPIETFRDFPEYIDANIEQFKDKKVLMYCTGGVRCERATAYLKKKGVSKEVYQIEGGIQRYIEQYPEGFFRGSNYVFDGRIAERINEDVLSGCDTCGVACDIYINCRNAKCNKQMLACPKCVVKYEETCGDTCHELVKGRHVNVRANQQRYAGHQAELG